MNMIRSSVIILSLFNLINSSYSAIASLEEKEKIVQKGLVAQRGSCIKTEHLFITPFHESDIKKYQEIQENDHSTPGRHFHQLIPLDVLQGYAKALKDSKSVMYNTNYPFRPYSILFLDPNDKFAYKLIGFFILHPLTTKAGPRFFCCSFMNYLIDAPFRNKGYGKEMLKAITTQLIPPLLNQKYPVVTDSPIAASDELPMPLIYIGAYIDVENIASLKAAMSSGLVPYDLTVDPSKKEGEGYQIELRFPISEESKNSGLSDYVRNNITRLPDSKAKETLIQECIKRTKQRHNEDQLHAGMFNNFINMMGSENFRNALLKNIKTNEE